MSVELQQAPAAASSPSHPDHTRWVKERMLEREVSWLRGLGLDPGARAVEQKIDEGMLRLAARKREKRQLRDIRQPATRPDRDVARELAAESGYDFHRGAPRPLPVRAPRPFYPCLHCGVCDRCRREKRAMNIIRMARAGDDQCTPLAYAIIGAAMRAQARSHEFEGLTSHDANRVLTRIIEDVCDKSVRFAGAWR